MHEQPVVPGASSAAVGGERTTRRDQLVESEFPQQVLLDMSMLIRSRFFVGNPYSTLSKNVARVRRVARDVGTETAAAAGRRRHAPDSNLAIDSAWCQLSLRADLQDSNSLKARRVASPRHDGGGGAHPARRNATDVEAP